jgi:DNA-binding transcriptional regulator YiaG
MTVADAMRSLRRSLNLSQRELGRKLAMTEDQIMNCEGSGKTPADVAMIRLYRLAEAHKLQDVAEVVYRDCELVRKAS